VGGEGEGGLVGRGGGLADRCQGHQVLCPTPARPPMPFRNGPSNMIKLRPTGPPTFSGVPLGQPLSS
jgi:hypothetical protein